MALKQIKVTERGRLENPDNLMLTPHGFAFPSAMSTLAAFMGLPVKTRTSEGHGIRWLDVLDHYAQVTISAEGFTFMHSLPTGILKEGVFGSDPIRDCFSFLGLPHKLHANRSIRDKDAELRYSQDCIDAITKHMEQDLPAIVLADNGMVILATGYEDSGNSLRGWVFADRADNTNKSFDYELCQLIRNWAGATSAVVTVFEPTMTPDREEIVRRSLLRGARMLEAGNERGYGTKPYRDWIAKLSDDRCFVGDLSSRPYIDPFIWDLAERRMWTSRFLADAGSIIQNSALDSVIEAFSTIHDKMWDINRLCSGSNFARLKDRKVRLEIIGIVKECAELDARAAEFIKAAVG